MSQSLYTSKCLLARVESTLPVFWKDELPTPLASNFYTFFLGFKMSCGFGSNIVIPVPVQCSVVSDSLQHHEPQHVRPPCPSPTPGVYLNPCPLSQWWHPTISSSVIPFSSCPQSFPSSGSFQMTQFFASGGQSIGFSASTSVLPMNTQDWSPLEWTGWIFLLSIYFAV